MITVKIVAGTYGHKVGKHIEPKDRASEPFVLTDDEARRLVELGVAEIITDAVADGDDNENLSPNANPSNDENDNFGQLDAERLERMKLAELKTLADDMGIDTSKMKIKNDFIQAIVAVERTFSTKDDTNDSEQPPTLDVEAPIV